jgi:hypothetical protein
MRAARQALRAIGLVVLLAALPASGAAASSPGAPSLTLDRTTVGVGEQVLITLHDWPNQMALAISLCGNAAARGSIDCDLTSSLGYGVSAADAVHAVLFRITRPPVPCPCVIQVTNTTQTETAFAPVDIPGFPSAPVAGNGSQSPLAVTVHADEDPGGPLGWIKSSLGGPTTYAFTVVVDNRSAQELRGVQLTARAGRRANDQARVIKIVPPPVLAPGASWTHIQKVTLAAPVIGRFIWHVEASGIGPAAQGEATSRHRPLLLMLLILVLVADVTAMAVHRVQRAARKGAEAAPCDDVEAATDGRGRGERPNAGHDQGAGGFGALDALEPVASAGRAGR